MPRSKFSVQFPSDRRVATLYGKVFRFKAGVPKTVDERTYRQAIAEGGIDGNVKLSIEPAAPSNPDSEEGIGDVEGTGTETPILAIARAMREIIDEADPDKLTESGRPKAAEVNDRFGSDTTKEQREEAYKLIEEGVI